MDKNIVVASDAPEMGCLEFSFIPFLNAILDINLVFYEHDMTESMLIFVDAFICYDINNYTNTITYIREKNVPNEDIIVINASTNWMLDLYDYIISYRNEYLPAPTRKQLLSLNTTIEQVILYFQTHHIVGGELYENKSRLFLGLMGFNIIDFIYENLYTQYVFADDDARDTLVIKMENFYLELLNYLHLYKKIEDIDKVFSEIYEDKYAELRKKMIV